MKLLLTTIFLLSLGGMASANVIPPYPIIVNTPAPAPTCSHGALCVEGIGNMTPLQSNACDPITTTQCQGVNIFGNARTSIYNGNNAMGVDANANARFRQCDYSVDICAGVDAFHNSHVGLWSGINQAIVLSGGALLASDGSGKVILTSSSPSSCTGINLVGVGGSKLVRIINTGPTTTIYPVFYDEIPLSATCIQADAIYGDGISLTLGAGQVINLGIPLLNGLAYKLSGALGATDNIVLVTN